MLNAVANKIFGTSDEREVKKINEKGRRDKCP